MSLFSKLFSSPAPPLPPVSAQHAAEVKHWNDVARRVHAGERLFWLGHPRVHRHYTEKTKLDGVLWREWLLKQWGRPARAALELGCGQGLTLEGLVQGGTAESGVGIDLEESRFEARASDTLQLRAADVNQIVLEKNRFDLIYSLGSFHHFERLEHIMEQVHEALTEEGFFILEEFVGPPRFQWSDLQLSVTGELLALMPTPLRWYANGIEKRTEGRSTPEEVIRVCPSEAIRSNEIVGLFYQYFDVVHANKLGGTIQHLLYSGIIQNFPDDVPEIDRMIDAIDSLETRMIESGLLSNDFVLLVGKKKSCRSPASLPS